MSIKNRQPLKEVPQDTHAARKMRMLHANPKSPAQYLSIDSGAEALCFADCCRWVLRVSRRTTCSVSGRLWLGVLWRRLGGGDAVDCRETPVMRCGYRRSLRVPVVAPSQQPATASSLFSRSSAISSPPSFLRLVFINSLCLDQHMFIYIYIHIYCSRRRSD